MSITHLTVVREDEGVEGKKEKMVNEDKAEIRKVPDGAHSASGEKELLSLFPPTVPNIFPSNHIPMLCRNQGPSLIGNRKKHNKLLLAIA